MMNTLINRSKRFTRSKVGVTSEVGKYRSWLRSALLISLLSASSVTYAGALHDAAKSGNLEQVQLLVVQGVDVNGKATREETPLMIASLAGNGEIVNYLLQRGADINVRNSSGMTALHAAAYTGHTDIVLLLITKGAGVNDASNRYGVTPLHVASEENHIGTVQELLRHGADTTAVEINGYSAMSRSGFREHWEVLKVLLASGAVCQDADKVGDWLFQECSNRAKAN
jgi:ankyrin repeat protein